MPRIITNNTTSLLSKHRTTNIENIITFFQDKSDKSIIYLEASSHYDYGFKVGKVLGFQYRLIDILETIKKIEL